MTSTHETANHDIDDMQLRDWLLHRLPASTSEALEDRLMHDDVLSAALLDVEYGLFDAFARGQLTPDDAAAMMEHLMPGAAGRERSRFARALVAFERARVAHASARRTRSNPNVLVKRRWRIGMLAAAGLFIAVTISGVWLRVQGDARPQVMPTITLLADLTRGAGDMRASVSHAVTEVRLQLEVQPTRDDEVYRLTIGEGADPHVVDALVPRRLGVYTFVEAVVPMAALAEGANRIAVHGQRGSDAESQQWVLKIQMDR